MQNPTQRAADSKRTPAKPAAAAKCVLQWRVDVASSMGAGSPVEIAVTVFLPEPASVTTPPIAIFGVPGGGYSRGYYDMHFPGHDAYSEAEYHTDHGFIFVACDPVGVGDSALVEPSSITFEMLAATYDAAVQEVSRRLVSGHVDGFPALTGLRKLGIGQSMGGKVTVLAQGRHATFEGVAILGASAIHTVLPQPSKAQYEASRAAHVIARGSVVDASSVAESSHSIGDFVYPFHWEDVPRDILDADMSGGYPLRRAPAPPFGSLTIPPCAVTMMSPGAIAREAANLQVPVLVGVGERDTCPNPLAEPAAYRNSRDVAVYVVPRMAHMHNFASTRLMLWDRIEAWARRVAGIQGSKANAA